jgi:hypothetical protein
MGQRSEQLHGMGAADCDQRAVRQNKKTIRFRMPVPAQSLKVTTWEREMGGGEGPGS